LVPNLQQMDLQPIYTMTILLYKTCVQISPPPTFAGCVPRRGKPHDELRKNNYFAEMKRFRGGLVFKAHRLLYHSTLGLRIIKKKRLMFADLVVPRRGKPHDELRGASSASGGRPAVNFTARKKLIIVHGLGEGICCPLRL